MTTHPHPLHPSHPTVWALSFVSHLSTWSENLSFEAENHGIFILKPPHETPVLWFKSVLRFLLICSAFSSTTADEKWCLDNFDILIKCPRWKKVLDSPWPSLNTKSPCDCCIKPRSHQKSNHEMSRVWSPPIAHWGILNAFPIAWTMPPKKRRLHTSKSGKPHRWPDHFASTNVVSSFSYQG